jgi:glycosyltransferase involved in cell wall biosynthesis
MEHDGYYILNDHPLVVSCVGNYARDDPMPPIPDWMKPSVVLEHASWYQGYRHAMERNKSRQEGLEKLGIEHHLIVNSPDEEQLRLEFGVRGGFFSRNQFVNEFIFRPREVFPKYDAVYVARLRPFKRHALARNVSKLLILTDHGEDVPAFCPKVAHADFNRRRLSPRNVANKITEARVGLCLSREEGAMRASMEYLFCGLPVVTTESRGGRHIFFDRHNSTTVPPDPDRIAEAVAAWNANGTDREQIRSRALARVNTIRREYCEYLSSLFLRIGAGSVGAGQLVGALFGPEQFLRTRLLSRRQLREPRQLAEFSIERIASNQS